MSSTRKSYPSDVSDEEWAFVAPYLTLLPEDVGQRRHDQREVFNVLRYLVWGGISWRILPHDFPRWELVYQQYRRWLAAGCLPDVVANTAPPSWTAGRCSRRPRVVAVPATMDINAAKAPRAIWRSIPWDTCWHCWSRRPISRTAPRLRRWRPRCRR